MESMDRALRGWLHNTAVENYWRVADWYELDDLIQDGYCVFLKVSARYPNVANQKNLMALFKVAFVNHIHDLSKKKTRGSIVAREHDLGVDIADIAPDSPDIHLAFAFLPPLLRKLVVAMQTDPRAGQPCRRRPDHRETTQEKLARIIGVSPDSPDLIEALRQALKPDDHSQISAV